MLIPPEKCLLGSKYVQRIGGRGQKLVKKFGYFIPLIKLLHKLVKIPQVEHFILNDHVSHNEFMQDVCDGSYIKSHNLMLQGEIFLQFVISYDDLELQNPLRSNKTHKLGMFYFTLLNIPPQYRSQLNNIFLLALGRMRDIKQFGLDQILHDFISSVKLLRDESVYMVVGGERKKIRGDLIFAVCDTPAAAFLSGFKESSFAFKSCRMCNMTGQEMKQNFFPQNFNLHDRATYEQQCDVLHDHRLRRNRGYWSKMYGINRKSVLSDISDFPVTQNIIQDPMHCLLEGVCGQEIAMFLNRIIYDLGIVSLNWFNDKLKNFRYLGRDAGNKLNDIERVHIIMPNMFIKQKASVILTLVYILPIIMSELFNDVDPYYRNFLACMKMTITAFCPYADETTAGELEQLMYSYCTEFPKLYPGVSIKPKMHYMLHLPQQLLKFGPLRHQNTMRFEAKHGWFKDYRWKNFVNLPFSLSEKHQLYLAHNMTTTDGRPSKMFVYKGDVVKEGETVIPADLDDAVLNAIPDNFNMETCFYKTDHVELDCLEYISGSALLISEKDMEGPIFGCLREILCCDKVKLFVLDILVTESFNEKCNGYEVSFSLGNVEVKEFKYLKNKWPLPIYFTHNGKMVITNRASSCVLPY